MTEQNGLERSSATDELRRLLDERGVEWRGGLPTETMVEADGLDLLYVALPDGRVRAFIRNYLTPEQAIEATLGGDLQAENDSLRKELAVTNPLFETLNAANDGLIAENAELKAENAHLWESVQNAEHEESVAWDRVRSAERRNDKLRELVRDFYPFASGRAANPWLSVRLERMRELGVEV